MSDRREIDLPEDPTGIEEPHDVLAAEEFAMPTRSAGDIPPDPTGIQEPHDVLAAEEFPVPGAGIDHDGAGGGIDPRSLIPGLLLVVVVLLLLRRRRRRGDA
jgi:MYXO-CTERM domain-containing protein